VLTFADRGCRVVSATDSSSFQFVIIPVNKLETKFLNHPVAGSQWFVA
jgi:hypothetical protein